MAGSQETFNKKDKEKKRLKKRLDKQQKIANRKANSQGGGFENMIAYVDENGQITDTLPNAAFKVKLDNGHEIIAHISGKMRMNFIKILEGDKVAVELSPYDLTRGRITYRYK